MFALGAVTAVAQLVAAVLVPPSPRFLVRRGQVDQARASLARLRPPEEVEPELEAIVATAAEERYTPLRELFSARFRPGVVVGIMMALMNALVGVGRGHLLLDRRLPGGRHRRHERGRVRVARGREGSTSWQPSSRCSSPTGSAAGRC
jgi:hypothetical protein